jgi:hypothetical protein
VAYTVGGINANGSVTTNTSGLTLSATTADINSYCTTTSSGSSLNLSGSFVMGGLTTCTTADTIYTTPTCKYCNIKMRGMAKSLCTPCKDMNEKGIIKWDHSTMEYKKPEHIKEQKLEHHKDGYWTLMRSETETNDGRLHVMGAANVITTGTTITTTLDYVSADGKKTKKQIFVDGKLVEETLVNEDYTTATNLYKPIDW